MAYAVLSDRVERLAISDRQALLMAAAVNGAKDYTPISVDERVEAWERWLNGDEQPAGESFADRVARFQEQVQELDALEGVA